MPNSSPKAVLDLSEPTLRSILQLGRRHQIRRRSDAAGRCLVASLEFVRLVRQRFGVELDLVRWDVVDDPEFVDHWAVSLGASRVIDLTRVQVDGDRRIQSDIDDYPPNLRAPTVYPSAPLLGLYRRIGPTAGDRLPGRFMLSCAVKLFAHDLARAWRGRSAHLLLRALRQFHRQLSLLLHGTLVRGLERCLGTLLARIAMRGDLSAWSLVTEAGPIADEPRAAERRIDLPTAPPVVAPARAVGRQRG